MNLGTLASGRRIWLGGNAGQRPAFPGDTMPDILVTEVLTGKELDELAKSFELVYSPELWRQPEMLLEEIARFRALMVRNQTMYRRN